MSIPPSREPRRSVVPILWLVTLVLSPAASAQEPDPVAERQRIARERLDVEAAAREAEAACAHRFVVTACIDRARAERRDRMQHLDRQRALLDEAERKRRAADRRAQIEARQRMAASAPPAVDIRARDVPVSKSQTGPVTPVVPPSDRLEAHAQAASQADAAARRRAIESARRADEAKAHREQAEQRAAARAATRKAPLPVPSSASQPAH